ncbi:hypothetical protein FYJ58_08180 [Lachnospiraceae bacterium WCA-693-APC-MOT-I]|uniref:CDP-Glycerol:Poly(Glycerophosphate) glycerophosphotransferase n=2 Tax=Velocimicrobium porci TaxID=2606634 RepID=A0A6L5Y117_9FIRM|nr:hypothetical protein [Velocimicrobium porci]
MFMNNLLPKEEMQLLIQQCFKNHSLEDIWECINLYKETFETDEFINMIEYFINYGCPLVSLICLDAADETINEYLEQEIYSNLEVVKVSNKDSIENIIEYILTTQSKYICFFEKNHIYDNNRIANMVFHLEANSSINVLVSPRNFIDSEHTIIAHNSLQYSNILEDSIFIGRLFLEHCICHDINLYGNLSTLMVSTQYAQQIPWKIQCSSFDSIKRLSLLYNFLLYGTLGILKYSLVSTILKEYKDESDVQAAYEEYVSSLADQNLLQIAPIKEEPSPEKISVAKHITFFYTDKGEYYNLKPIADYAVKRGYTVEFTDKITQKAEIGVYCQHVCFPENSKFSLILLHDLAQGHNRWPNIWELEPWNNFDIGIVPGKSWASRWSECACQYYVNPRCGTYEFGYPKGDLVTSGSLSERAVELKEKFNFKYDFSVLYAPSWENDEKEDDFILALSSLPVNLLIKQAHWPKEYSAIINNIKEMRSLHENKYENVYYIEPEESIITALELCDLVVSDESSVMTEALLFDKPSLAVTDWLIPDTIPSRFSSVPFDYVIKIKKVQLREYVEKLASRSAEYDEVLEKGKSTFSNRGNCCKEILDAIEYYTNQKTDCDFLSKKLTSKYTICSMWN